MRKEALVMQLISSLLGRALTRIAEIKREISPVNFPLANARGPRAKLEEQRQIVNAPQRNCEQSSLKQKPAEDDAKSLGSALEEAKVDLARPGAGPRYASSS